MERGTHRGDEFGFGDPFGSFGGARRSRSVSLMSSLFGGKDPFDDPFFTHPFGNMLQPSSFLGPNMLNPEINHFGQANNTEFLEEQRCRQNSSKGPVIQELSSDNEDDNRETADGKSADSREPSRSRSTNRPYVQHPDEATEENMRNDVQRRNEYRQSRHPSRSFSFQSSTVTYGGVNGAYYTASTTRKTSGDGVMVEESKEADTTTGKATHRISKGIHEKAHSVTRKLDSDGKVDTLQTLHNLNEDELAGFEKAWTGQARQHLPGWSPGPDMLGNERMRGSRVEEPSTKGWALPSASKSGNSERRRTVIPIEFV